MASISNPRARGNSDQIPTPETEYQKIKKLLTRDGGLDSVKKAIQIFNETLWNLSPHSCSVDTFSYSLDKNNTFKQKAQDLINQACKRLSINMTDCL